MITQQAGAAPRVPGLRGPPGAPGASNLQQRATGPGTAAVRPVDQIDRLLTAALAAAEPAPAEAVAGLLQPGANAAAMKQHPIRRLRPCLRVWGPKASDRL